MIPTIIFYSLGLIISTIAAILPDLQLWPEAIFTSLTFFTQTIFDLRVIFFFLPTVFVAVLLILRVISWALIVWIIKKVVNYARGVGHGI